MRNQPRDVDARDVVPMIVEVVFNGHVTVFQDTNSAFVRNLVTNGLGVLSGTFPELIFNVPNQPNVQLRYTRRSRGSAVELGTRPALIGHLVVKSDVPCPRCADVGHRNYRGNTPTLGYIAEQPNALFCDVHGYVTDDEDPRDAITRYFTAEHPTAG